MKTTINVQTKEVTSIALTADEIAERAVGAEDRVAQRIRSERDDKLKQSDWTQVADAPVDKAAWATYRQALRDIPLQDGFPHNITWPDKP